MNDERIWAVTVTKGEQAFIIPWDIVLLFVLVGAMIPAVIMLAVCYIKEWRTAPKHEPTILDAEL
jgi:hypothetical protein